jgi:YD repeat-containing protein
MTVPQACFQVMLKLPVGTYNVSYWSKGDGKMQFDDYYSPYDIIDRLADSRGWQYHQVTVNVTNPDYFEMYPDAGGNSILVDDIRIHPTGAQMTTYTFSPLVGMTSMTDAKGMTVYYEYDNFQRLINIKDQDGNIKTHYCYNYAGQQTDCAIVVPTIN